MEVEVVSGQVESLYTPPTLAAETNTKASQVFLIIIQLLIISLLLHVFHLILVNSFYSRRTRRSDYPYTILYWQNRRTPG